MKFTIVLALLLNYSRAEEVIGTEIAEDVLTRGHAPEVVFVPTDKGGSPAVIPVPGADQKSIKPMNKEQAAANCEKVGKKQEIYID